MDMSLTIIEILAFAGLFQCVSILVYLFLRAGRYSLAFIPIIFFFNLTLALYLDFGTSFFDIGDLDLSRARFWIWMMLCPLSILFILQFSDLTKPVGILSYLTLLPLCVAILCAYIFDIFQDAQLTYILGAVAATLSLPFLWFRKNFLSLVKSTTTGHERYWVILSLIGLVVSLIGLVYAFLANNVDEDQYISIRTVIGLLFVYLSASYLFRIYPPPIKALTKQSDVNELKDEEKLILPKIKHMLEYEKVYLEASYSRSDMARELEVSESLLSRLMN